MHLRISLIALAVLGTGCAAKTAPKESVPVEPSEAPSEAAEAVTESEETQAPAAVTSHTLAADVAWNPAFPDREVSPEMALVAGNPKEGAFTFMVRFPAGHKEDIHSHPADFTGIVTSGVVNHGRSADEFDSISEGSVFVQPAEEVHYTACANDEPCSFVGHLSGPMVMNPAEAPEEGEMQYRVIDAEGVGYEALNPQQPQGPKMAVLVGDRTAGAFQALVNLPAGASGPMHYHSSTYSAVLLMGAVETADGTRLPAGSYWTTAGGEPHITSCVSESACVFYAVMEGAFDMVPVAAPAPAEDAAPAEE